MTATEPETRPDRWLDWDGCYNVRDLGGFTTRDGRRTRWGALVRSDLPARLSHRGRQSLVDHGVRTTVDLRVGDETAVDGPGYPFEDIRYVNVPFNTGRAVDGEELIRAAYEAATSRYELTRLDLDWNWRGIGAAVKAIANADPGGVLVHCHAGKDRTGITIALLLSLLGVSDEDIADDYALSARVLEPLIADWLDSHAEDAAERQRLRELAWPSRESMLDVLRYMRERYGSAEAYLRRAGVDDTDFAALRDRLLEPVG